ncbi:CbrC family protein [Ferruginibacter sp.]
MVFKYFEQPGLFTGLTTAVCDTCGNSTACFDGTVFYGEESIDAICPACLANGALDVMDIQTNTGDTKELKRQLKERNSDLNDAAIKKLVKTKTQELEKQTPHLISWQDWDWPCAEGDYCRFIGYGSKEMYESLAAGKDAKDIFAASIYYSVADEEDADILWDEYLPGKAIKNYEESSAHGVLFYVFKSQHSDKLVSLWDSE